jgi:hypothetical protein
MSDFQKVTTSDIEMGKANVSKAAANAGPATPGNRSLRFSEAGLSEATIVWKNLDKFVEIDNGKSKKQILFNVGGVAKPGDLIALMGRPAAERPPCSTSSVAEHWRTLPVKC